MILNGQKSSSVSSTSVYDQLGWLCMVLYTLYLATTNVATRDLSTVRIIKLVIVIKVVLTALNSINLEC